MYALVLQGSASPPPPQLVYAYLPIRSYGLPFALQADWLVPASRQDVTNTAWNQQLRESVPVAFMAAVKEAQQLPGLSHSWLQFVPQSSRVGGFFRPVVAGRLTKIYYFRTDGPSTTASTSLYATASCTTAC